MAVLAPRDGWWQGWLGTEPRLTRQVRTRSTQMHRDIAIC